MPFTSGSDKHSDIQLISEAYTEIPRMRMTRILLRLTSDDRSKVDPYDELVKTSIDSKGISSPKMDMAYKVEIIRQLLSAIHISTTT
jgi:hypothetical protein